MRERASTDRLELTLDALFPTRATKSVSFTLWSIHGNIPSLVKEWSGGFIWVYPLEFNRRLDVGANDGLALTRPRLNSLLSRYVRMSDPRIAQFSRPDQLLFLQYHQMQCAVARIVPGTARWPDCFDALSKLYPAEGSADTPISRRSRSHVVKELRQSFIAMLRLAIGDVNGTRGRDPSFMREYLPCWFYLQQCDVSELLPEVGCGVGVNTNRCA